MPKNYITTSGWPVAEDKPIGSGPYKFAKYTAGDSIQFRGQHQLLALQTRVQDDHQLQHSRADHAGRAAKTGKVDLTDIDLDVLRWCSPPPMNALSKWCHSRRCRTRRRRARRSPRPLSPRKGSPLEIATARWREPLIRLVRRYSVEDQRGSCDRSRAEDRTAVPHCTAGHRRAASGRSRGGVVRCRARRLRCAVAKSLSASGFQDPNADPPGRPSC